MKHETRRSLTTGRFVCGRSDRPLDRRVSRAAIRASGGGGNSIAHCDNRTYREPLADGHAAPVDRTTNGHRDTKTGADTAADVDAGTAVFRTGGDGLVPAMDCDAIEDAETDLDPFPDAGAVSDAGPLGSLAAVLLG